LELKRREQKAQTGIAFQLDGRVRSAIKKILPFHPTQAQKRVLKEIATDMEKPHPMRRLLQGDVGSGKTIVSFEAAIIAMENGFQVALMAPHGDSGAAALFFRTPDFGGCRISHRDAYRLARKRSQARGAPPHRARQRATGHRNACAAGRES
jgi:late competence protein required for DNA uptake (superfamily II DNA/RNA helicase)